MVDITSKFGGGLRLPRPDLYSNLPEMGTQSIRPGLADVEVERQQALDRIAGLGGSTIPRLRPPPETAMQTGPGIYYSPGMDRFSVGGVEFGREDYDVALESPAYLGRPSAQPQGADWRRISPTEYQQYLTSISEGRGFFGNLGVGVQNVAEGLLAGTGRGLQMAGAEGIGEAFVRAGEAVGLSPAQEARSAAIAGRQGILGQIGTATVQSAPTLAASIGAGLGGAAAGAALGGPIGAAIGGLAGIAASIFPMELQSSWEAAEQNGLDPTDPEVQTDILMSTLFKTGVQSAGPAVIARGFSPALRAVVGDVAKRTLGQRIIRGVGTGALEGSAEAIAQITDRVVFDPELRAQLNEADIAALAPMVVQRYGEEALVAFGAGFLLGGAAGALGTPTQARPVVNVESGQPVNALTGAPLSPQPEAPATVPEEAAAPQQPLGLPAPPRVAGLLGPSTVVTPPPSAPQAPIITPPPGARPLAPMPEGLEGPVAQGYRQALAAGPGYRPPPAVVGYTDQQAEAFTPEAMEQAAATQARLTGQRLVGTQPPEITAPPAAPAGEQLDLRGFEFRAAPPAAATETALGAQLNKLLQQMQARQQPAPVTTQAPPVEVTPPPEAAVGPKAATEITPREYDAAYAEWELIKAAQPNPDSVPSLSRLNKKAQREWVEASRAGKADADMFGSLVKRKVSKAEPLVESGVTRTASAAPSAEIDAMRRQVEAARLAEAERQLLQGQDATLRRLGQRLEAVKPKSATKPEPKPAAKPGNTLVEQVRAARRGDAVKRAAETNEAVDTGIKYKDDPEDSTSAVVHEIALPDGEIVKIIRGVGLGDLTGWHDQSKFASGAIMESSYLGDTKAQAIEMLTSRFRDRNPPTPPTPPPTLKTKPKTEAPASKPKAAPKAATLKTKPALKAEMKEVLRAVQEPSPAEVDVREQAEDGAAVGEGDTQVQAAPEARQAETKEVTPSSDKDFLDAAITEAETATSDSAFVEAMADVIFWGRTGSKTVKQEAADFLARVGSDPETEGLVRSARALEAAQRKGEATKAENVLDLDFDVQLLVQTMNDINAGKLRDVTPSIRTKLREAWKRAEGLNPTAASGDPLVNYIDVNSPEFFVRGKRNADGIKPVVSKDTGRTKLASYDQITDPIPTGKAKMVTSAFVSQLAVKPKVRLYRNVEEFQRKAPELFAEADAARPQGDFATVKASGYSFGDGNVLIFTDHITNEAHLRAVLAHETLGHFGMRGLLPAAQFNTLMDGIYDLSDIVRTSADAAMLNRGLDKAEAVEEYLADFAAMLDTSLIARIWATLKTGLNKLGLKFGDEAARYLVTQARRYVRNGKTSALFVNSEVARRLHSIESGQDPDGTGRFMPAKTFSELGQTAGLLNGSTLPINKEGLISSFRNMEDLWDRVKSDGFSLTNYRAKQNPGLAKYYELTMGANRLAMRYKIEANERMAGYLNPSLNLGFTRLGDGVSKTQKQTLDEMIYAAQRYAASKFTTKRSTRASSLIQIVDGMPVVNEPRLEELRKQGRRTLKEFRDGFTYTHFVETAMTDAQRQVLRAKRDGELANANTDEERKAIEAEYKAQIDSDTFFEEREAKWPGIPELTEDSIEWKQYERARETVEIVEVELLKARYMAHLKVVDNQLYEISEAMGGNMTAQDRKFLLRMNEKYRELYLKNTTTSDEGQVVIDSQSMKEADDFIRAVNEALNGRSRDKNDAVLAYFDQAAHDDIEGDINEFKTRYAPRNAEEKFVVQNKMKEIIMDEISRNDGGFGVERTIATGYTPILREGLFDVRMVAVDPKTGRELKMKDSFREQLSYHQIETIGEAAVLRDRINELFGETEHDVAVWDGVQRKYVVQKVRLEARAGQAVDAISAPPQQNLNEFIVMLRRFSINLDPKKMESVVLAMTRQNSRTRNRLQRAFVPGADTDAAKAISGHVESRAATIAKTLMRPDMDRLMNMNLQSSRMLWGASDEAKLARLKENFEAAQADPNATDARKMETRRAYDEYVYQRKNTLRKDSDGVDMSQRYYTEAARGIAFMETQKNLDESDLGSGDLASRVRAATSMAQLGASPATAALNLLSLGTNTIPYLMTYNTKTAFGGGFGAAVVPALFKAIRQVGTPGLLDGGKNTATYYRSLADNEQALAKVGLTRDEALFLAREIAEGVATPALSNSLIASARGRMTNAAFQKFVDGWMVFFNRTEQSARYSALLAAYRLQYDRSIQGGAEPEIAMRKAREFAVKTAEDTLGEYAMMNRPAIWRGGPQQFLYMYKIFPTMSVQLMRNLPRSGQLVMLGGLLALSGVAGLPFAEDMEDLVDTIAARLGIKTPSLRVEIAKAIDSVMPGLSPKVINGLANAFVPGDIAGRTSLGDLFPGTALFLPGADVGRELLGIAGPVAGMAQQTIAMTTGAAQWATYTAGLTDRPASLEGVFRNAPVTMVRAWADAAAYVQSGAVVDRRGYMVSEELSAMTVMARALGFYPTAAAEQYGVIRVAQRISNYQRDMAAVFYNAYVQARLRGDNAQANAIVREVREWNQEARGTGLEINNFQSNAIRRLRDAQRSATERTTRYAPEAAQAQYERVIDLLGY